MYLLSWIANVSVFSLYKSSDTTSFLLGTVYAVLNILAVYYFVKPINEKLSEEGNKEIADLGQTILKMNIVCYALIAAI